jgi:hypothetical protein
MLKISMDILLASFEIGLGVKFTVNCKKENFEILKRARQYNNFGSRAIHHTRCG